MQTSLEDETAALLNDLLAGQDELLKLLARKRQLLGAVDVEGLAALAPQEQQWIATLQQCLERRRQLLARAAQEGCPRPAFKPWPSDFPRPATGCASGSIRRDAAAGCCNRRAWSIGWSSSEPCSISRNC